MRDTTYTPVHEHLEYLTKQSWGPMMWRQLHDRPEQAGDDLAEEGEWLEQFRAHIPCDDCRWHFTEYIRLYPPDFTDSRTYFRWTWGAHNSVRFRKNQPIIPWQNAWGKP